MQDGRCYRQPTSSPSWSGSLGREGLNNDEGERFVVAKNPEKRLEELRAKRNSRQSKGIADWAAADASTLQRAVCAVGFRGGALRLGYTRDGGAYAIGIYLSNESTTEYVRPDEDIDSYLEGLIEDMEHYQA